MPNTNYNKMYESDKEPVAKDVTSIETVDAVEVIEPVAKPEPENPAVPVHENTKPETRKAVVHNCTKLNVRENPNPKANVLTTIYVGDEVTIYGSDYSGNYYSVCTEHGVEGYCVKDYLKI